MIDYRREANHIYKEFQHFQRKIGDTVIWFKFDLESSYDSVYDEGGRNYMNGIALPVLWIDQQEDPENYGSEGHRSVQQVRMAVSARTINETGIGATEAHGGRLTDIKPDGKPWWDDRMNDIFYYDGRFYEVSNFQIEGRAKYVDVVVGISGIEVQPEDESVWDLFPTV